MQRRAGADERAAAELSRRGREAVDGSRIVDNGPAVMGDPVARQLYALRQMVLGCLAAVDVAMGVYSAQHGGAQRAGGGGESVESGPATFSRRRAEREGSQQTGGE